ncbi:bifunctional uridylyltransferase/uridylyl-removing protein GlnD [Spirabiliibacterium falconis]|uniref:bifunctional uridylyltransferase/uridylyl-removing protein GlnD n=1 Tax=Spirabiliibacterium falconis TaxID=572023 RepID=UPI001AAD83FC|nr:bifunctional uridylyltransferase/uridylyl-removing protein GlnD [Spirabiliibacterium falconis]MBE2894097.1 bifunctional uridylyltransferase/uridylyl-removing protein GlnD [Spirabiliibacterium falconis]
MKKLPQGASLALCTTYNMVTVGGVKAALSTLKAQETEQLKYAPITALLHTRTAFFDQLIGDLWQHLGFSDQRLCVMAVGGFGRKEMFPHSDLDLLLLTQTALCEQDRARWQQLVQFLWDCGLNVGQAVRTLRECECDGKADLSIATTFFEARRLCGSPRLAEELNALTQRSDFWTLEAYYNGRMAEREQRYQRYHNTSYNLEPDVKYSPGGLRDLHLLSWLTRRHNGDQSLEQMLQSGFIYREEYELLHHAQHFLFKVRFALHLLLKRADNRLLFAHQLRVCELLGFAQAENNRGVEAMMRHYFRHSHDVMVLSQMLLQDYSEQFLHRTFTANTQRLDTHFLLQDNAIKLRTPTCFAQSPDSIITLFLHLTTQENRYIHASTLRQLRRTLSQRTQYLIENQAVRQAFVTLLNQPNAIARALVPMRQVGVLNAYFKAWDNIEGLMQFDLFHAYTVDEHTLRVLLKLEDFLTPEAEDNHPLCATIFPHLPNRVLLYITALFHDIAKGRGGDHAELGAIDVYDFAKQHFFSESDAETMAWLVQNHLLMSVTAQRRDIYDPDVINQFARKVKTKVRLDYLLCLTVADISATNNQLWNSWKRSLLQTLYQFTLKQLAQGSDELLDVSEQVLNHRLQALDLLSDAIQAQTCTLAQIHAFWARCPQDYFLRNNSAQLAWHIRLITPKSQLVCKVSNRFSSGGSELFVYCPDQPYVFNKIARTLEAKKVSIHDAQIITSSDGYCLDSFIFTEHNGDLAQFERRREIESAVKAALTGEYQPSVPRQNRQLEHFSIATQVRFLHRDKADQTEIEIFTLDKPGLLAQISAIFSQQNLSLINAKIMTIGEKAEDFFILQNAQGVALTPEQCEWLETALYHALD